MIRTVTIALLAVWADRHTRRHLTQPALEHQPTAIRIYEDGMPA